MEWGEHYDKFAAMQAQGLNVPALARMPELPRWAESIARAYGDLQGDRSPTGALRWSAVTQWARAVGIADAFWLFDVLQVVDAEARQWLARKSISRPSPQGSRLKNTR